MPILTPPRRRRAEVAAADLDPTQRAVVEHRGRVLRVLGAPGSGRTTAAVHTVLGRVAHGVPAARCLVLADGRIAAGDLRERLSAALGGTTTGTLASTVPAFGFAVLADEAARSGGVPPRLLSGPEQDVILAELLAGHAVGEVPAPDWPDDVLPALGTRGFRTQLRELLMRAVELGIDPVELREFADAHDEPAWRAGASVFAEYDEVTALSRPGAYDPSWILRAATNVLRHDARALERVRAGLRLLVVDDAQELTPAAADLVETVVGPETDLVLLGDPDAATGVFRGADPRILGRDVARFGPVETIVLARSWRQGAELAAVSATVAGRIDALGGVAHRRPAPVAESVHATGPGIGGAQVAVTRSEAAEAHLIAARLRRARLLGGVPWSRMAVMVRGAGRAAALRRVLAEQDVPMSLPAARVPLRDEPAVRPLLALLRLVVGGRDIAAGLDDVLDLLVSPIGGADALALRRLRRSLRALELAAGGTRNSDALVLAAVHGETGLLEVGADGASLARVGRALRAGRAAARRDERGTWAAGVTAESVLWAIWRAAGLAESWRRVAVRGGRAGRRADRDLDAVLALFHAAARYTERLPGRGPDGFVEQVGGQDVAGDSLVARAPDADSVTLTTPAGSAGREWDVVVVAGVQEGVWPDLRVRGSLLGSERLVDVVTGRGSSRVAAVEAVRYDETRLFLTAVTRARHELIVTAVDDDDDQPSTFLDLVDGGRARDECGRRPVDPPPVLTLPGVVARLRRRAALAPTVDEREHAAGQLARLADLDVPGADPESWWDLRDVSDDRPVRGEGTPVAVSPSRLETFSRCGLRWLLTASGGESGHPQPASLAGTLVHDIAAEVDNHDRAALESALQARVGELGDETGWLARRRLERARTMLRRLADYDERSRSEGWEVVARELDARVDVGRARLRGRVDRLERDESGALRVVDLKTGSTKPTGAEVARLPQLAAYQVAVERGAFADLGERSAGAALLQLGPAAGERTSLQVQTPLEASEEPRWAHDVIEDAAEGMAGSRFEARTGPWCRVCPVRSSCPLQPEGERL